jgi:citronellol/citronellal dehydrogenase
MGKLKGKTVIVTGSSRGIGRAIALRCAQDGANVVIAAKTSEPNAKLAGTIHTVAKEVEEAGGRALAIQLDVRNEANIQEMMEKAVSTFGGIDILVNNAAAISLTNVEQTPLKRFDLIMQVNTRGVFLCSQAALPHLKKSNNPHILNISPPLSIQRKWFEEHLPYTLSKYGNTMCTLGMSAEFEKYGIAVNSLWPKLIIETAATVMLLGQNQMAHTRKASIMADAAYEIFATPSRELTGQTLLDEDFLKERGEQDFSKYATSPGTEIYPDLFL